MMARTSRMMKLRGRMLVAHTTFGEKGRLLFGCAILPRSSRQGLFDSIQVTYAASVRRANGSDARDLYGGPILAL